MSPTSRGQRPSTPELQDTEEPRTSHSGSSSPTPTPTPTTKHSTAPPGSPFSSLPGDSSSAPSRASSLSQEQHDNNEQMQQYPLNDNYPDSHAGHPTDNYTNSNDVSGPTPQTRRFQEAFLTLLSLLPAHKYPASPTSPPQPPPASVLTVTVVSDSGRGRAEGEKKEDRDVASGNSRQL
ncbi:hypothetical protein GGR53DRAFT_127890 [Hypoxylon sp. FL1150]|nr:hypothetical protein GGR53DRAFT_127890 [Hypoxylon sp. FL1150]